MLTKHHPNMSWLIMSQWQQKEQKHIYRTGSNNKRTVTVTLYESHNGTILSFQLIYKGKTARLLSNVGFPDRFSLLHNEKYWSNKTEAASLINEVLVPYIKRLKKEKTLPRDQKSLLI